MRNLLWGLVFLLSGPEENKKPLPYGTVESEFPLLWQARMGIASFRSNVVFTDEQLIIGSNGDGFMDFSIYDRISGVYVINRQTGNMDKHFANEKLGDMDVNGVMRWDNKYYFGNDNEEFLCTELNGKIIWRNPASGDIEHEAVMIKSDEQNMIVYATETGEVCAVDPSNGKIVWDYFTPDFCGYKPGDNRSVFKVKSYFRNTFSFFQKPKLADLNKDGTPDLVYLTWDDKIYALDGKSGRLLWLYKTDKSLSLGMVMSGSLQDPLFTIGRFGATGKSDENNNHLLTINREGKLLESRPMPVDMWDCSLNSLKIENDTTLVNIDDSILFIKDGKVVRSLFYDEKYLQDKTKKAILFNKRDALFATATFPFSNHQRCVLLLSQKDNYHSDCAIAEIISLEDGAVLKRFSLPINSEMAPIIKDVNKDGLLDLIISSYDGYLYCYNMNIKAE